jgi:hypothetical protein
MPAIDSHRHESTHRGAVFRPIIIESPLLKFRDHGPEHEINLLDHVGLYIVS